MPLILFSRISLDLNIRIKSFLQYNSWIIILSIRFIHYVVFAHCHLFSLQLKRCLFLYISYCELNCLLILFILNLLSFLTKTGQNYVHVCTLQSCVFLNFVPHFWELVTLCLWTTAELVLSPHILNSVSIWA